MLPPASVETDPLLGSASPLPITLSAMVCGAKMLCAPPIAPQSNTAAHVAGAAHLTHALAVHEAFPVGSAPGAFAPLAVR